MPRIVLCCAAGMSTSMLVNKMKAEAQQRALALEIYAVAVAEFERELPNADVILLGPQVKYEAGRLTALAAPQGKAVAVIDMADYGMMRGAAVLDKALALLEHLIFSSRFSSSSRAVLPIARGALYAENPKRGHYASTENCRYRRRQQLHAGAY